METETIESYLKEEINDYIELLKEELQERDIDDLRHDEPLDVIFEGVMHSPVYFTLEKIIYDAVKEQLEEADPERAEAFFD